MHPFLDGGDLSPRCYIRYPFLFFMELFFSYGAKVRPHLSDGIMLEHR